VRLSKGGRIEEWPGPRDGYPWALGGRIAEILFKNGRDETESALIDAPSAKAHPNSLTEARFQ
jgi:hypothetical protein